MGLDFDNKKCKAKSPCIDLDTFTEKKIIFVGER